MRRVVVGTTPEGLSTVLSDGPPALVLHVPPGSAPEILTTGWAGGALHDGEAVVHHVWALDAATSAPTQRPPAATDVGFDVMVGATKWIVTEMGPNLEVPMHQTATADYGVVLRGAARLGLQQGTVELGAGDVVVIGGVQHSWRAGPDGVAIATVLVGLPPESYQASNVPTMSEIADVDATPSAEQSR